MPIYEYHCNFCGHRIEQLELPGKVNETPRCCCKETERVISASSIRFKGPGFYVNDYGRKKVDAV